jgi:hypothetical protein
MVTVPPVGTFTVTVTTGLADLIVQGTSLPVIATGTLPDITVSETRNYVPGWSVSGQESAFTGSGTAAGSTISADNLGWVPTSVSPSAGTAILGSTDDPGSPGLGTAALLASAVPGQGFGTNTFSASLTLGIPNNARAGPYTGTLTITFIESSP